MSRSMGKSIRTYRTLRRRGARRGIFKMCWFYHDRFPKAFTYSTSSIMKAYNDASTPYASDASDPHASTDNTALSSPWSSAPFLGFVPVPVNEQGASTQRAQHARRLGWEGGFGAALIWTLMMICLVLVKGVVVGACWCLWCYCCCWLVGWSRGVLTWTFRERRLCWIWWWW